MDGAQMEVASDWVGLSLRRVLGFGGRVRGGSRPRMKNHEHLRLRQVQV